MIKTVINSDSNLQVGAAESSEIEAVIEKRLGRFADHITRVVVHLRDENAGKEGPNDKRCMIEARPEGRDTVNVTHSSPTIEESVSQAARKMERVLDDLFSKLRDHKGKQPMA